MAPQPPSSRREPIHDVHPLTGISIEVFFTDRALETFGRGCAGWFWWPRRRGFSPDGPATGPFATSYVAYNNALQNGEPTISFGRRGVNPRLQR
jgi:hypothetical protein